MSKAYCSKHFCAYEQVEGCLDCAPVVQAADCPGFVVRLNEHLHYTNGIPLPIFQMLPSNAKVVSVQQFTHDSTTLDVVLDTPTNYICVEFTLPDKWSDY